MPLFLHHVAQVARNDPRLAARALEGLRRYGEAPSPEPVRDRPILLHRGGASIRDCGGSGPPVLLVPSLINPPEILDLDEESSFADALAAHGLRALLLDWGPAQARVKLDIAEHVERILVPLIRDLGEQVMLVGYCLGGTMALAAAQLATVRRVATLAAPWHFSAYPREARDRLSGLFESAAPASGRLGLLPMEVLQSAFWSLDPQRIVAKFARFGDMPTGSAEARRFVALESWANGGEPLPHPAAVELVHRLFGEDQPGQGLWRIGGQPVGRLGRTPALHLLALKDLITPAAAAPEGSSLSAATGHIGLVVGAHARTSLHPRLFQWLLDG